MPGGHHSEGPANLSPEAPVKVVVTGAAGQICYNLVFAIAQGAAFGPRRRVILHLLDIPGMETKLAGVVMELEDIASDLLAGVVATTDPVTAFTDVDAALLIGARPRGPGMERKDLLLANAAIFKAQGELLDRFAKKSVRVLVVGNPANTNALIASHYAPSIPKAAFTALTRLDMNRARAAIARRVGVLPSAVRNVLIWGNHSTTQFPDARFAMVEGFDAARPHDTASVSSRLAALEGGTGTEWLRGEFILAIQNRGKAVIDARGASSAASASTAICDHVRDWWCGSEGRTVCMGVHTAGTGGAYGLPEGLIFSLPVVCEGPGTRQRPEDAPEDAGASSFHAELGYRVVTDLSLDTFSKEKFAATLKELLEERELALGIPAA